MLLVSLTVLSLLQLFRVFWTVDGRPASVLAFPGIPSQELSGKSDQHPSDWTTSFLPGSAHRGSVLCGSVLCSPLLVQTLLLPAVVFVYPGRWRR